MKSVTFFLLFIVLIAVFVVGLMAANYSPGNVVWDGNGLHIVDPRINAQATRTAQQAHDEAVARELERRKLEAQADKAVLDADTERRAQTAAVIGRWALYIGLGLAGVVLVVGGAAAAVAWANKRASSIYPNPAGQYPVVVTRGFGWVTYHDPNRGLGPTAIYRTPTIVDTLTGLVHYLRTGRPLVLPAITSDYPSTASEPAMVQVATQAQAVGLMAAATRPQQAAGSARQPREPEQALQLVRTVIGPGGDRMPQVRVIDDPKATREFMHMLEAEGK